MLKYLIAAALLVTPVSAAAQEYVDWTKPAPYPGAHVTIRVVNTGNCYTASLIDNMRNNENERLARVETRRLRKLGWKTTTVIEGAGIERTMPGDAVRVFTSGC